jgi:hypothetical protein
MPEEVCDLGIHMLIAGRREMGHIFLRNDTAFGAGGVKHSIHVYCILDDEGVSQVLMYYPHVGCAGGSNDESALSPWRCLWERRSNTGSTLVTHLLMDVLQA